MCITFLKISRTSKPRFILGFNREVEISKPTAPLAAWEEDPNIIGGRDLVQKGSCLALNVLTGSIAILTNYSGGKLPAALGKLSRGDIVKRFVSSDFIQVKGWKPEESAVNYIQEILQERDQYLPFNLIVGNLLHLDAGFHVLDYTMSQPIRIPEDHFFGMSNSSLAEPYAKTTKGLSFLSKSNNSDSESQTERAALEYVLRDSTYYKHHESYDPEDCIFVKPFKLPAATIVVGTISTTFISLDENGVLEVAETFNCLEGLQEINRRAEISQQVYPGSARKKLVRAVDRIRLLLSYSKQNSFPIVQSSKVLKFQLKI